MKLIDLIGILEKRAPLYLSESWDNPGLLVGRRDKEVKKAIVALDVTEDVISEAIIEKADVIVTHHPLIFGAVKTVNDSTYTGRKILRLIENGICHYAMHTNLDTAFGGTNDTLAKIIGLEDIEPLAVSCEQDGMPNGLGRLGTLKEKVHFGAFAADLKDKLSLECITLVGNKSSIVSKVGLCTGAGFEFIDEAYAKGCDLYITSDVKFHEAQKALDMGICLIDATHYGTENIIVPVLKEYIDSEAKKNGYEIDVVTSKCNGQVFGYV
ncbi:Nif3-like dinuclear metal center hexameric protein [Lachnospiraceae bacterium NSJ-143]|nr:Nif3-like dinuclear metal center hexameric protein [Lachnospiraceae bacterium NSJ-143]